MKKKHINRRHFMATTAASTIAGLSAIHIVPNSVIAAPNRTAPSDQLRFGNIGVGGRGMGFVRPDSSIALCDVDERRLAKASERVGGKAKLYKDYRELLEQDDLDAVFITSPDHWHALMTIHACQAGKDVYVEKPACKTIEEGRAMVEATNRYARVVQVGSQGRSQDGANYAYRYINDGQIGRVKEVRCWHYDNPKGDWTANTPPPKELDYDKWVGPNRFIPYNPTRVHGRFRWMFDYGGGQIRDRGAHVMSIASWVMNCDETGPVLIDAKGDPHFDGLYDLPALLEVKYTFKNPDWTLIWGMPGEPQIEGVNISEENKWRSYGGYYMGEKGNLIVTYGDGSHTQTEEKAREYCEKKYGLENVRRDRHRDNFENCIRTREKPIMHIEAGHQVSALCILGNLSLYLGRPLQWDPVHETVLNDDEANRLLSKPGRGDYYI